MWNATGYEALVYLASSLQGAEILSSDAEPTPGEVSEFLEANREVLESVQIALKEDCTVHFECTEAYLEKRLAELGPFVDLGRAFLLDATASFESREFSRAVDVVTVVLSLVGSFRPGSMICDCHLSSGVEGMLVENVRKFRANLPKGEATRLANELIRYDSRREPFDNVLARDRAWDELSGSSDDGRAESITSLERNSDDDVDPHLQGAVEEWIGHFQSLPQETRFSIHRQHDDQSRAMMRLLAIELALAAYHKAEGAYPVDVAELSPGVIAEVPLDPITENAFVYHREASRFVLYSPGPTGIDNGGTFGSWPLITMGHADLCLNMHDYTREFCPTALQGVRPVSRLMSRLKGLFRRR